MKSNKNKKKFYELRDQDIIDYNVTEILIGDELVRVRKPVPEKLNNDEYGVCIGAAQTFGPFAKKPYPLLLNEILDFPILNLGRGGASANFFLRQNIIDFLNNSRFVVIQIMSARGIENSTFRSSSKGGQKTVEIKATGEIVETRDYYKELIANSETDLMMKNVSESRSKWIENYKLLLNSIKVPKILFWFSQRDPVYQEEYTHLRKLFSKFPQLVNDEMVNSIKPFADEYVEYISQKGIPQKIIDYNGDMARLYLRTETIVRELNTYYPSPEMHTEAAGKLTKVCRKYIST